MNIDDLIVGFDRALRTLAGGSTSARPYPAEHSELSELTTAEKAHAAGLMRINHSGEICAQALYSGQGMTSSNPSLRGHLDLA
ncbi:MAG: demethoxyubiquinone hydroxylase family protein, partial [Cypionkella sp.]